eukprot:gb/GECG01005891.1/.p1 GENE.gb/GECG01005891.1/~~gb/GECG01005891.1/.p1  ORF type:complete len:1303 (+),score=151.40 gb/GECG01005891.1/:1-3909(+)
MSDTAQQDVSTGCSEAQRSEARGARPNSFMRPNRETNNGTSFSHTVFRLLPLSIILGLVAIGVYFRFQLASWTGRQVKILLYGVWTSPVPEERGEDANFWVGIVATLFCDALLIQLMEHVLQDKMWKMITRVVFMADEGAQFEVVQRLLKKTLHGKLLIFLTKQLTMLLLWFFTPPVTFGHDVNSMLYGLFMDPSQSVWQNESGVVLPEPDNYRHTRLLLDRKLALLVYVAAACYWWACQSGLLSFHASSARQSSLEHSLDRGNFKYLTPLTAYVRNRKSMALLLMSFCLAGMRIYEPLAATGVDVISFFWLLISKYPLVALVFGMACVIPSMLLGGWLQRSWGTNFGSLMCLTALHVFFLLYSLQVGKVLGLEIYTDSLRANAEADPVLDLSPSTRDAFQPNMLESLWINPSNYNAQRLASLSRINYSSSLSSCESTLDASRGICNIVISSNAAAALFHPHYHATEMPSRLLQLKLSIMFYLLSRALVVFGVLYLCATALHAFYTIYVASPLLRCSWNMKDAKLKIEGGGDGSESLYKFRDAVYEAVEGSSSKQFSDEYSEETGAAENTDTEEGRSEEQDSKWWSWETLSGAMKKVSSWVKPELLSWWHDFYLIRETTQDIIRQDTKISTSFSFDIPVENPTGRKLRIPDAEFELNVVPDAVSLSQLYGNAHEENISRRRDHDPSARRSAMGAIRMRTQNTRVDSPSWSLLTSHAPSVVSAGVKSVFRLLTSVGCDILTCVGIALPGPLMQLLLWTSAKDPNLVWCLPFPATKTLGTISMDAVEVDPGSHVVHGTAKVTVNVGSVLLSLSQHFKNVTPGSLQLASVLQQVSNSLLSFPGVEERIHPSWRIGGFALVFNQSSQVVDWLSYRIALAAFSGSASMGAETVAITTVNDPDSNKFTPPFLLDNNEDISPQRWMCAFDQQLASLPSSGDVFRKYQREIDRCTQLLNNWRTAVPVQHANIRHPGFGQVFRHFEEALASVTNQLQSTQEKIQSNYDLGALTTWMPLLWSVINVTTHLMLVKQKAKKVAKAEPGDTATLMKNISENALQQYTEKMIDLGYAVAWMQLSNSLRSSSQISREFGQVDSPIHSLLIACLTLLADRILVSTPDDPSAQERGQGSEEGSRLIGPCPPPESPREQDIHQDGEHHDTASNGGNNGASNDESNALSHHQNDGIPEDRLHMQLPPTTYAASASESATMQGSHVADTRHGGQSEGEKSNATGIRQRTQWNSIHHHQESGEFGMTHRKSEGNGGPHTVPHEREQTSSVYPTAPPSTPPAAEDEVNEASDSEESFHSAQRED